VSTGARLELSAEESDISLKDDLKKRSGAKKDIRMAGVRDYHAKD
jgi:hypothetical protein